MEGKKTGNQYATRSAECDLNIPRSSLKHNENPLYASVHISAIFEHHDATVQADSY